MMKTYSLALFLLCLAFHESNARHIGVFNKVPAKASQSSSKNDDKSTPAWVSIPTEEVASSVSNKSEADKTGSLHMEGVVHHEDTQRTIAKKPLRKHQPKDQRPKVAGSVQTHESLATVPWKLPRKKRGEQQPGFNLDYAPPKTHPPVHN